jgi:predicted transcriptional regulator
MKGIGKAFKKAVGTEMKEPEVAARRSESESLLLNSSRQEIFKFLCASPCAFLTRISEQCDLAVHTAKWHLNKMVEGGYLMRQKTGKRSVFYPAGFIDPGDVPLFELLNVEKARSIFNAILSSKGISQKELGKALNLNHQAVIWYTGRLCELDLLSAIEDGRYKRYFPTDTLAGKREGGVKRMRSFKDGLMKRLKAEGVSPEVMRSTEKELVLSLKKGSEKVVMILPVDPYATVLM